MNFWTYVWWFVGDKAAPQWVHFLLAVAWGLLAYWHTKKFGFDHGTVYMLIFLGVRLGWSAK